MAFISSSLGLTMGPRLAGMIRLPELVRADWPLLNRLLLLLLLLWLLFLLLLFLLLFLLLLLRPLLIKLVGGDGEDEDADEGEADEREGKCVSLKRREWTIEIKELFFKWFDFIIVKVKIDDCLRKLGKKVTHFGAACLGS